jgi:hypothetical protein
MDNVPETELAIVVPKTKLRQCNKVCYDAQNNIYTISISEKPKDMKDIATWDSDVTFLQPGVSGCLRMVL